LLKGKEPDETLHLRLLDPACGSGSFLIRAFERVCEHWQRHLTAQRPPKEQTEKQAAWRKKHRQLCWVEETTGDIHLTVDLKRKISPEHFWVDLDGSAVEVTQLSLYLRCWRMRTGPPSSASANCWPVKLTSPCCHLAGQHQVR